MFRKARENSDVGCLQQGTSGRFTTRTEDLCTVQQKAIVQCPLVGSWGRQKLGWNEACAGGSDVKAETAVQ